MLNALIHPVGTVTSNLPVSAELPKQIRHQSCTVDRKSPDFCDTYNFSVLPKGVALPCWGFILAGGEGGKKMIEV